MAKAEHKTFAKVDETRTFENGNAELITLGGATIGSIVGALVGLATQTGGTYGKAIAIAGQPKDVVEAELAKLRLKARLPSHF